MADATYLGFDAETTGIDPDTGILLEIGMIAYDKHLQPLNSWSSLVNADTYADYRDTEYTAPFVEKMHTDNGLWHDLATAEGDTTPATVEAKALAWINNNGYAGLPMLGSSITLDRSFLKAHMPQLLDAFHYRSLDATSLCLVAEHTIGFKPFRYLPTGTAPAGTHRVLADIAHSAALAQACLAGAQYEFKPTIPTADGLVELPDTPPAIRRHGWIKPDTKEVRKYINNWQELAGFTTKENEGWYKNTKLEQEVFDRVQGQCWYDEQGTVHLKDFASIPGIADHATVLADIQLAVYRHLAAGQASVDAAKYRRNQRERGKQQRSKK